MTDPDQITCDQCEGERGHWSGPACGWACDWCGGCYDWTDCEPCDGTGELDDECMVCGDVVVNGSCVSEDEHDEERARLRESEREVA